MTLHIVYCGNVGAFGMIENRWEGTLGGWIKSVKADVICSASLNIILAFVLTDNR